MPGWRHLLSFLALIGILALSSPAAALAQSAGDNQYVDPLAGQTTPGATKPGKKTRTPASTRPASSSSPAPASSSPAPQASTESAPTATTAASTQTTARASDPGTLPFTGLDLIPCLAIACGLLGAGLVLRRATAQRT